MLTHAKMSVCILFYLNKIGHTEKSMIRAFCDDKHFTAAVHSLFGCLLVFVALRPKSTAMVIAGRSVHLTTLFPGQA